MDADFTARITEILDRDSFTRYPLHLEQAVQELAQAAEQHYRPRIEAVEQLDALPDGVVVRSAAGTIATRFDRVYGVVFGDDRPFPWIKMALPLIVLWSPGAGE